MSETFSNLNGLEILFLVCAAIGAVFLLIRLILLSVGGGVDHDVGFDLSDSGGDAPLDLHHVDSDVGFTILSVHGLSAFLMMFGLVGFAFYRQSNSGAPLALAGGFAAGLASVWIIGRIFRFFGSLQSSGTLATRDAVGSSGTVYLKIPAGGTGRVMLSFQGRLREFDAVAADGSEIATNSAVRVTAVNGNVLVVETIR